MAITYNQFSVTLGLGNLLTVGLSTGTSGTVSDTASSGSSNILGDTTNDTFAFAGKTYTFVGTVNLNLLGGGTLQAFVGSFGGSEFIFAPGGFTLGINIGAVLTPTPGTNGSGEWDLGTGGIGCFFEGTRLRTPGGSRAVDQLKANDLVLTAEGLHAPVRWLGRTAVHRYGIDPLKLLPIRIRAHALGRNTPSRDLLLSPNHAVLLGGVLVQASALVNDHTICREYDTPPVFSYYHVELDTHSLLLAEDAPAESFLEGCEDIGFANWATRVQPPAVAELPYPRVKSRRQLPLAARQQLADAAEAMERPYLVAA